MNRLLGMHDTAPVQLYADRATSPQPSGESNNLDLNKVLRELTKSLRVKTRGRGIEVHHDSIAGWDLGRIDAEPAQIERIIRILAACACDAMPKGGVLYFLTSNVTLDDSYVRARPEAGAVPGDHVVLAVRSRGSRMSAQGRERMLKAFTTHESRDALGEGLSTCYWTVRQLGGHMDLSSDGVDGIVWRLYFPRVEESALTH